ncbi:hypothetical protein PLUTE_a6004 [Pseudoalteromonas luteoviolacea DSM 6061]|nr:hypothetical protein [Pseudoalteromonas luteoviolacea DSM 6061]
MCLAQGYASDISKAEPTTLKVKVNSKPKVVAK